jgi:uncharacterized repeat protein (TIGR01451 family)
MGGARRSLVILLLVCAPAAAGPPPIIAFDAGSLIIPMDVDYQDAGMLKAFGLLDKLLRAGVPVHWCIKTPKLVVDAAKGRFEDDFTASAKDVKTSALIANHGYRGGPFVIAAADAAQAMPVIAAWQAANGTAVHAATAPFSAQVPRTLTAAPRIAVFADGSQGIAFGYLNAAGIPDELGAVWSINSPDVLSAAQVMGTLQNHADGALFRPSGQPAFCEIMTMHYNVNDTSVPEVAAEFGSFLQFPVHVNAECQAVNAIEGAPPVGGRSRFVTTTGFTWPAPNQPNAVQYANSALPFAQQDGPFKTVGGSEPAYALPMGGKYYDSGIVMVRAANQPLGVQDVWMTGYARGYCPIDVEGCNFNGTFPGKVSYLGGHQYSVKTPISTNPDAQGTRLFLNSLYEAGCVTSEGQPTVAVTKAAPATTYDPNVTFTIQYVNNGPGPALKAVLTDALPMGAAFVSASNGGLFANGVVTWTLGDLAAMQAGSVTVTVKLAQFGMYANSATASFAVGLATKKATSNTTTTVYQAAPDLYGVADLAVPADLGGSDLAVPPDLAPTDLAGCPNGCPAPQNPCQKAVCQMGQCVAVANDGIACKSGNACLAAETCLAGACQGGLGVACPGSANPCLVPACDPQNGCGFNNLPDGMKCDDGDACTTATTCAAGQCEGGMMVVCPQPMCTLASCDPIAGCQLAPDPMCDVDGGIMMADMAFADLTFRNEDIYPNDDFGPIPARDLAAAPRDLARGGAVDMAGSGGSDDLAGNGGQTPGGCGCTVGARPPIPRAPFALFGALALLLGIRSRSRSRSRSR